MKFVEKHFSKHHLLHAPHKWFFAFISSPIHYLEMHYKKRYHLNFVHARKLFLFDTVLLFSMIVLLVGTIFWWTYDPTVTDLVYISIEPSHERILSGEYTTYNINYHNDSNTTLTSPTLEITLPRDFIIDKVVPEKEFDFDTYTFSLKDIKPAYTGEFSISGWFYGTPHLENPLLASVSYTQEGRKKQEKKVSPHISILRGSVLEMNTNLAEKITNNMSLPATFNVINNGDIDLNGIEIPLIFPIGVTISEIEVSKGTIENNTWFIDKLTPEESTELSGAIHVNLPKKQESIEINITPTVLVNERNVSQETLSHKFEIAYPHLDVKTSWENDFTQPNEVQKLIMSITNDSNVSLSDLTINIPLPPEIVDINKFVNLNGGILSNNTVTLSRKNLLNLSQINSNGSADISLFVPIKYSPQGGTDINLSLSPTVSGYIPGLSKAKYETNVNSPNIAIGTQVLFNTQLVYYTDEGDQLGRGPLPPEVDKETKYWAMIQIINTTSRIENLVFSATLPNYVSWTGKTSVTHGVDVAFNTPNRSVSWSMSDLPTHTTTGIYFELAITPNSSQLGISPILLQNIHLSTQDAYIKAPITRSSVDLDISIPTDIIGKEKGVLVE